MKIEKFTEYVFEHKLHKNQLQILNYFEALSKDKIFIFCDTETSGLGGHKKQQLTQISAISYEYNYQQNKLKETGTFNKKIKISSDMRGRLEDPKDRIKQVFKFNHYGDKIKDDPKIKKLLDELNHYGDKIIEDPKYYDEQEIIKDFKNWVTHAGYYLEPLLIMQNAIFDMNMIVGRGGSELGYGNKPWEVLDTKQIIQLFVIPIIQKLAETDEKYKKMLDQIGKSDRDLGLISSSMSKWGPFFGINMSGYHDALTDCRITAQMFTKIVDLIKDNIDLDISKYQVDRIKTRV